MFEEYSKVAFVAYDAGGANQIIALICANQLQHKIHAYLQGPADKLSQVMLPEIVRKPTLDDALIGAGVLVVGSGWSSKVEIDAIKRAKELGVPSVCVLDHWTNYRARFEEAAELILPDTFWTVDPYAFDLANEAFPGSQIVQIEDYYLAQQISGHDRASIEPNSILYVLEPTRSTWGKEELGEFQALDYFVSNMTALGFPPETKIVLRLHPSEAAGKYDEWIQRYAQLNVSVDCSEQLSEAVSKSAALVGCESYGLVIGLAMKRKVYCSLPPWAPECRLPHSGLIKIKNIVL